MNKFIFIFLIALSGCGDGSTATAESAAETKSSTQSQQNSELTNLQVDSMITIRAEQVIQHQNLELRLLAVEDSRCAIGESCIWAGQLVVTLEVANEKGDKIDVKLIRKREAEIANAFDYSLLLLGVDPHPKKDTIIQLSDQVVKLKIVKNPS